MDWTSPGATVLVTSVDSAIPLVLQDGALWWIDRSGGVTSIPIGAPLPSQVVGGLDVPTSLAVDGSSIFWFDDDGVGTCDAPACADRRTLAPGQGQGSYGSMVVDRDQVYWSDSEGIFACPRSGCPAGGPVALATGEHTNSTAIHALAVDGANLYFVRLGGSAVSIPKHGGSPLVIATGGPRFPYSIAVDQTAIYWIGCNDTFCSVMRAPLAGGSATALDTLRGTMYDLAVDDDGLYYTANVGTFDVNATVDDTGIVKKIDKRAGASAGATLLAQQESDPAAIAVDGKYVYWATSWGAGSVKRIAK